MSDLAGNDITPKYANAAHMGAITSSSGFLPGDVISYMEMCSAIGVNLQRGMNFRLRDTESVILMSLRPVLHTPTG